MAHALANKIPSSNVLELPRNANRCAGSNIMAAMYAHPADGGRGFIGAFHDKPDQPDWAREIARYDREDFRKNTPGTKKLFSDIASTLASGEGGSFPNFRFALDAWDGQGDKPFTRYQQLGSCVDSSRSEHEEALAGYRAAKMQVGEKFRFACTYGPYAERGYCSDGWNGSSLAAVSLRTGAFFSMLYDDGKGNHLDLTDEQKTEMLMGRTYCRSGLPTWIKDYVHANHAYEDGAITEFDGDKAGMLAIFADGGILQTGGTNTSGSSKPFVIGRVGGHEQSFLGADDSPEAKKFFTDKGFSIPTGDFPCIASQTWGSGWSAEVADQYWPFGTNASGKVVSQAEVNTMRANRSAQEAFDTERELLASWGWGEKPEGAWLFLASQVLRCFSGDIFAWRPHFKGFPGGPAPVKPNPPINGLLRAEAFDGGIAIRGEVQLVLGNEKFDYIATPADVGQYKLITKPVL